LRDDTDADAQEGLRVGGERAVGASGEVHRQPAMVDRVAQRVDAAQSQRERAVESLRGVRIEGVRQHRGQRGVQVGDLAGPHRPGGLGELPAVQMVVEREQADQR
jgi:hypothetical protein